MFDEAAFKKDIESLVTLNEERILSVHPEENLELIREAKNGNSNAIDLLLNVKYKKLIFSSIPLGYVTQEIIDELLSLAWEIGVIGYKEEKGAKFSTFLYTTLRREILRLIEAKNAKKRKANMIDIEDLLDFQNHSQGVLSQIIEEPFEFNARGNERELLYNFIGMLPEREKLVISLHLHGYTNTEIASKLNITYSNVGTTLGTVRNKLLREYEIYKTIINKSKKIFEGKNPKEISKLNRDILNRYCIYNNKSIGRMTIEELLMISSINYRHSTKLNILRDITGKNISEIDIHGSCNKWVGENSKNNAFKLLKKISEKKYFCHHRTHDDFNSPNWMIKKVFGSSEGLENVYLKKKNRAR